VETVAESGGVVAEDHITEPTVQRSMGQDMGRQNDVVSGIIELTFINRRSCMTSESVGLNTALISSSVLGILVNFGPTLVSNFTRKHPTPLHPHFPVLFDALL
jgi:hypothetical protein